MSHQNKTTVGREMPGANRRRFLGFVTSVPGFMRFSVVFPAGCLQSSPRSSNAALLKDVAAKAEAGGSKRDGK